MSEQVGTMIELLQDISDKLSSIDETLYHMKSYDQLMDEQRRKQKLDEKGGFVRGADYYRNLDKRKD